MEYCIIIHNILNLESLSLNQWLLEHCKKWIVKFYQDELVCIINTSDYSRLSTATNSILKYFIKRNNFTGDINDLFKIKKTIKENNDLDKYFTEYFINIDDLDTDNIFTNIEFKNYNPSKFKKIINDMESKNTKLICNFCKKMFKTSFTCNRHKQMNCKFNDTNIKSKLIEDKIDDIQNSIKELSKSVNIINNTTNNINSNNIILNLKTKVEKLNFYCKNTLDIDTFIKNFESDIKYQLTNEEALVLLNNIESNGIKSYGEGLSHYLKRKYCKQYEDITGQKQEINKCILPFVSNDINLRSHYEKSQDGWILVKSRDKIKQILSISDNQIYNHHNKPIYYNKKGKNPVCNILLKRSDYLMMEKNYSQTLKK
jgi:hypothetical protein